jgi:UDP-glucose:(heptosyl)LPS alpha-1,3-glucosyltransferase
VRGPNRPFLLGYPWFMVLGSLAVRRWRRGVVHATGAIVVNKVDVIAVHYCHQVGVVTPRRATRLFRAHNKIAGLLSRVGERRVFTNNPRARFVCVSDGVAEEIREHYPQLAERVLTIHNGVDTDTFAPGRHRDAAAGVRDRLAISPDRLIVAFVGSEWERKGLRAAIEALALSPGWDLIVAGDGDEHQYRSLAESIGVGDAVHWLGVVEDIEVVYEMADAFVLPSRYDTFSLVTFEAAASGLAVLACPVNGVRELIEDGVNGFLIDERAQTIAGRLQQLRDDPALRAALGAAARSSALEFNWEQMVSRHEELYSSLWAGRRAS